ncbi:cytidine deaminase [Sunxiuqinia elliptica]|uniref:Cytidine deaminase n=1 Tax=Sunxiuqinia elliptica TaxID=655355 RepID=A0A4R6H5Y0_9BACT|nr:cytidine deaminase [Sunxiuqinia elliptica]TDO03188.1 cytidine deaminase [Sunxiuqinia elliptica]TDO59385.1 cytidine deaminase [Sunxiuqinia elliptica]
MKTKEIKISISEFDKLDELSAADQELIQVARKIAQQAYAPYSNYQVGSALRLEDGTIISGNNQENASSPLGNCAERTAIFWANANHPNLAIETIVVTAIDQSKKAALKVSPCGACRQVMLEAEHRYKKPIRVILDSANKIEILQSASHLLPMSFNGDSLKSMG